MVGVALAWIDLDVHRLPDVLVVPSAPAVLVLLAVAVGLAGPVGALGRAVLAALVLFAVYFLLMIRVARRAAASASVTSSSRSCSGGCWAGSGWGRSWCRWPPRSCSAASPRWCCWRCAGSRAQSSIAFGPAMIAGAWVALVFPVQVLTGAS